MTSMNVSSSKETKCGLPPSSKLLIDIAKNEYDTENIRGKNLDTKGNMLFVLCTTPLLGILASAGWKGYYNFFSQCNEMIPQFSIKLIDTLLLIIVVIGFAAAFLFAMNVIALRNYSRMPLDIIFDKTLKYTDEESFSLYAASKYNEAVTRNKLTNDEKAECFSYAVRCLQISIVIFLIWSVVHKLQ